jgi:[ribosomal protein S5]-alanine N-acetyltransferase
VSKVYFENDQLRIIDFSSQHLTEKYVGWFNDPVVVKYSEQRHLSHTLASCQNYYDQQLESDNLFLALEARNTTSDHYRHIGNLGISIDEKNQYADISILIGEKDFWGKGIGLLAIERISNYLFKKEQINLISCGTASLNQGMIRLMEKLGMNPSVTFPNRFLINGHWADLVQGFLGHPAGEINSKKIKEQQ